jgi:hypothetical protein
MNKELVIAAYNRDYDWIHKIDPSIRITVYNKAKLITHTSSLKNGEVFLSSNVGRDVHTFFKHISDKYYSLFDYTFFSQDFPFDHVENYVEIINGDISLWSANAKQQNNGCWFFNTQYPVLTCDQNGAPSHSGLPMITLWEKLFKNEMPGYFRFTAAGHFCVSKELVHRKPKSFYDKVVNILEEYDFAPWVIERLEPYIFIEENLEINI